MWFGDSRIGSKGQIESAIYTANAASRLALTGLRDGQLVVQIDTNVVYSWDQGTSTFIAVGGGLVTAIADTNSIDLIETTGTLTADVKIQDTTSVDIAIDAGGLKATVLPAGVDHNSLANTHNLTTSIDHNSITNTHNLTTSIDHNSITNTHNLTTSIDHGSISGLSDDDHTQYHNDTRGDTRYFQKTEHINTSAGGTDAGKPIKLDVDGQIDATMINDGDISHGSLAGTHNLTTDIDHNNITNTHNLTTSIDHNNITNTHNLTTSIDHNSITNTHNLTTNIDHTSISNIGTNSHSTIDSHIGASTAHGTSGSVVGTSDTQALTNKDINGGTASDTSRLTIPQNTLANLTALTRKKATIAYDTTNDKVVFDNGSVLANIDSGGGGSTTQIQDFTTIGNIGDSSQQYAGHYPNVANGGYNDPGTTYAETIAYYKFATGALTTDETGTYTLQNNNSATAVNGILNTTYGTELNGSSQFYSHDTLLDNMTTVITSGGIAFEMFVNLDDGQPAAVNYLFHKRNTATSEYELALQTNGDLYFYMYATSCIAQNVFPNGVTGWRHLVATQDTTSGMRIFIDGNLTAVNSTATTLMVDGTTADFCIGRDNVNNNKYTDGKFAYFRILNKKLTQKDVDIMYSTAISNTLASTSIELIGQIQLGGSTSFVRPYDIGGKIVSMDTTNLYLAGGLIKGLGATDKLKILGR